MRTNGMTGKPSRESNTLKDEKLKLELRKLRAEAEEAEINRDIVKREFNEDSAHSDRNRVYSFFHTVDGRSVAEAMITLRYWQRRDGNAPIEIVFNSPGGGVIDGLALYDQILDLRYKGVPVTTVAMGMAASMGGILLQAGDKRVIGRHAHIMMHEVSTAGFGRLSEIEDELKFSKRLQDRCLDILAERSNMTKNQIQRKWKSKDWWISAQEALELGFVDAIT